ncbi:hypothetical protein Poli38472_009704 [Pythium oligandrum]|uniref:AB hydrolase-1 domain-containing protein n=1 Tax=Pythium oligandrum TaxID=41045 RepID=A0A8K1CEZ7_PYTOL|nr:hypothetical protein Poli38472_009704 [Pythium oligandrum]|eukprot:TMW62211.1 hypothetical protein Poli38472_009704 [Pythium oligandrum]
MMRPHAILRGGITRATRTLRGEEVSASKAQTNARAMMCLTRRWASSNPSNTPPKGGVPKEMLVHEGKAILKLMIGGVLLATGFIASSGFVIEKMKEINPMPAPGRFLELHDDAGNPVKVHYRLRGNGDVTVIFDGGVGETSFDWDKVAEQVAEFATVLSIDRPGLGFSTPGSLPRTASQVAKEYADILEMVNVPRNVVLVGHGAGGYNMRQLAKDLTQHATGSNVKCQGLVLVDALQENLRAELESVSEPVRAALQKMDANGDTVLRLAHVGIIRLITTVQRKKMMDKYSAEALPYVEFYTPTPAHRRGANNENAALPLTEERFRESPPVRGLDVPTVVLTHGKADLFEGMIMQPGITPPAVAALEDKWQEAQRVLAKTVSSKPALQIIVKDGGHCIHHEKPEEVTKVVRALVNETRGDGAGLESLTTATCPV